MVALRSPPHLEEVAPQAELSNEDLVQLLLRGNASAKETFYRRHFPTIWGMALRLLENRSDAEDVVQDTFATALDRIGDLRDPCTVSSWLVQIALRLVHRRFRRRKLLRMLGLDREMDDLTLESQAEPGLRTEARVELLMLERALRDVPVAHRMAWMLRYVEGYSLAEVATACSCSLATAKRRIGAAEAKVRSHVSLKELPHEEG